MKILALAVFVSLVSAVTLADDAFSKVEVKTLPNGLTYILSPSPHANRVMAKVVVNTGTLNENEKNSGIAHLLEHFLFRSERLKADTSYLDLIQEKGGDANGYTEDYTTAYFASMAPHDEDWLLQSLADMVLHHDRFSEEELPRIKNSVLLEIGQPGFNDYVFGSGPIKKIFIDPFKQPSFTESEFRVKNEGSERASQRILTPRLTIEQLSNFYRSNYKPQNMTVYVSGRLSSGTDALIKRLFSTGDINAPAPLKIQDAEMKVRPYYRSSVTSGTPYIDIGVKVDKLTATDEMALDVYGNFVSHVLMKQLRNKLGETYTASYNLGVDKDYGTLTIGFETNPKDFRKNYELISSILFKKAGTPHLSQEDFDKAVGEYSKHIQLADADASTALALAQEVHRFRENYHEFRTPIQVLDSLSMKKMNAILDARFRENVKYYSLTEPPLFWRYEAVMVTFMAVVFYLLAFRALLTGPFKHNEIRWVRKVKYPAPGVLEFGLCAFGLMVTLVVDSAYSLAVSKSSFMTSTFILSYYLGTFVYCGILVSTLTFLFAFTPKKLIVVGEQLYIKCISYRSRRIALTEISRVTAPKFTSLRTRDLFQIKWRLFFFDPVVWHKVLRIDLNDGRSFIMSVKEPVKAAAELNKILGKASNQAPIALKRAG